MEVFATTVGGSYSLTIAVGASVWGVVGVLFPWGGRLVLPFLLLLILLLLLLLSLLLLLLLLCYYYFVYVCVFLHELVCGDWCEFLFNLVGTLRFVGHAFRVPQGKSL